MRKTVSLFPLLIFFGIISSSYQLAVNELPFVNQNDLAVHDSPIYAHQDADIRSLLIHKVLSSLDIEPKSIVLSKNSKLAFTTIGNGDLRVIDISDREYPIIIGSLTLRSNSLSTFDLKSLRLSADEKTLFASNAQYLEIIDVLNPKKPVLTSELFDPLFGKNAIKFSTNPNHEVPTLALSPDEKTCFAAWLGLQIFNIANLSNPQILYSIVSPRFNLDESENPRSTSLALLPDGKTLTYANDTLDFYDVSNPATPQLINSHYDAEISISSILLSKDSNTIYVAGCRAKVFSYYKLVLKRINILDLLSPKTLDFYDLGTLSPSLPSIIGISQTETNIFIKQARKILVYDLIKKKTMLQSENMFENTAALVMIPNSDILIAGSNGQLQMIQLFIDFPNRKTFCLFQNTSFQFPTSSDNSETMVKISADPSVFFSVTSGSKGFKLRSFEAYNMANKTSPQRFGSYIFEPEFSEHKLSFFHMSPPKDKAFLGVSNNILILNISDPANISSLGVFSQSEGNAHLKFISSSQEGIGYVLENPIGKSALELSVINYSNMSLINKKLIMSEMTEAVSHSHLLLSKDGHTLFSQLDYLTVYNVSDPFNPIEIYVHQLLPYAEFPMVHCLVLSEDGKTLFAVVNDDADLYTFMIFDISDLTNFKLLQAVALPRARLYYTSEDLIISNANKKALLLLEQGLLVIDLRNLTSPVILGIIPFEPEENMLYKNFFLSPDEKTVYVQISQHKHMMMQINLENSFTLYLPQQDFLLGQKYTDSPMLLKLSSPSDFLLTSPTAYKIVKLSLYDLKIIPSHARPTISYPSLPYWITFDYENQILSVESKRQRELGSYTLYAFASKKIPFETFKSTPSNQNLLTLLVTLGYIDNQRFLTPSFGSFEDFLMPDDYEGSKEKIFHILESYRIETFTGFRVLPSLKLSTRSLNQKPSIYLITPRNTSIKIDIKLSDSKKAQFLQKTYGTLQPTITEKKSQLTMEGPLDSINKALQDLVINLNASCGGEITINDNLNLPVTEFIRNISDYFWHNEVPTIDELLVQQQIDLVPLYTGQYFSINLDPSGFSDKFAESLSCELIQREDGQDKNPPDWLSFHNLNIQGTPPEDLINRKINLTLIIKNEFKQIETPVVLNIRISWIFAGKTLLKYSPYILTAIGLIVFANRIRNILTKKRYRHPKDFYVRIGEEITPSVIFPIRFIAEEKAEGDLILKYLVRKMGSRRQIVESLSSYSQLDETRMKTSIKEIVNEMPANDKKKLRLSVKGLKFGEERVYKYVCNELTMWQLDLSTKETIDSFNSLKEKWTEFIEYDDHSQCFKINEMVFETTSQAKDSSSDTENESLLSESPPEVDMVILKKALIVYATKIHEINCFDFEIDVQVKLQIPKNLLFKFLKMDLRKINYVEKSRFMYGLSYRIQENALHIFGTPDKSFEGKILAFQIRNIHQRILNELWIYEASSETAASPSQSSFIRESQAKGKEYEVF